MRALALALVEDDSIANGVRDDETAAARQVRVGHLQIGILRGDIIRCVRVAAGHRDTPAHRGSR